VDSNVEKNYEAGDEPEAHKSDWSLRPVHRIDVTVVKYGERGPVYRVMYAGEVLRARARCPLFEACRALLAKGITGRLELWRPGKTTFDVACDVEVGAQHTIIETAEVSLRLAKWAPVSPEAICRLRHRVLAATDPSQVLPLPTPEEQTPEFDEEPEEPEGPAE
jgi:hypothetical protein